MILLLTSSKNQSNFVAANGHVYVRLLGFDRTIRLFKHSIQAQCVKPKDQESLFLSQLSIQIL